MTPPIGLRQYEAKIGKYCQQLEDQVALSVGTVFDASSWFYFFGFDVMGDLTFGESFHMLETGRKHFAIDLLDKGMNLLGIFSPTPWLARIGFHIPGAATSWKRMFRWSDKQIRQRLESRKEEKDISSWLIAAFRDNGMTKTDKAWLDGDAFLMISAGSGTTAFTLVLIFYYLAQDPTRVDKIREELDYSVSKLDAQSLQSLPYLNGIINETLRLHPPLPSAGLRETPSQGIQIAGQYIPGYTTVVLPVYSLHRRKSTNYFI